MLPCARGHAGRKLNSWPITADSAASEPLLFLYPQWYQSAFQQCRDIRRTRQRLFSQKTDHRDRVALAAAEDENEGPSLDTRPNAIRSSQEQHQKRFVPFASQRAAPGSRIPQTLDGTATQPRRPLVRQVAGTTTRKEPKDADAQRNISGESKSKSGMYNPANISGLTLAARLFRMSPVPHAADEQILPIDASFLHWLTGTSEENIWQHWDGSGCTIHVKAVLGGNSSSTRLVVLRGTQRGREIANDYLKHSQAHYETIAAVEKPQGRAETRDTPFCAQLRVDQTPKPASWTLKSFYQYIGTITTARRQRGVERIMYPYEDSYNKAVAKLLVGVFSDHTTRPFWSSAALQKALRFTCDRTDISFAASSIWEEFRQAGIVPDVACYNFEIKRRLRVGNVGGIMHLIHDMERTHIRPDATTWAIFFKYLRNRAEQSKFLALLSREDIQPSSISKDIIIQSLLETEFKPSDDREQCVAAVQRSMQKIFGHDWLTTSIITTMINKCVRVEAFQTISRILDLANKTGVLLDNEAVSAVSRAVSQTGHFEETLLLLQSQQSNSDTLFRQEQIEIAFTQAWNHQHINTCRVLWHYAASHGMVTPIMMRKIGRNLAQNPHPTTGQPPRLKSRMARLIVDTSMPERPESAEFQLPEHSDSNLSVIEILSQWVPNNHQRHQQLQLAHSIVERDVTKWQRAKPMRYSTFLDLIHEAFQLDMTWQKERHEPDSVQQLAGQTIKIDLEPWHPPATVSGLSTIINVSTDEAPVEPDVHGDTRFIEPQKYVAEKADDTTGTAGTFRSLFHICPASSPMAMTAATATATCTSMSLIDVLLRYLGLVWENG